MLLRSRAKCLTVGTDLLTHSSVMTPAWFRIMNLVELLEPCFESRDIFIICISLFLIAELARSRNIIVHAQFSDSSLVQIKESS